MRKNCTNQRFFLQKLEIYGLNSKVFIFLSENGIFLSFIEKRSVRLRQTTENEVQRQNYDAQHQHLSLHDRY